MNMSNKTAKPFPIPKPWVVVGNPGQADEYIITEQTTKAAAQLLMKTSKWIVPTDLMKRLEDGTLTTEF